jgi:hypothetical protein
VRTLPYSATGVQSINGWRCLRCLYRVQPSNPPERYRLSGNNIGNRQFSRRGASASLLADAMPPAIGPANRNSAGGPRRKPSPSAVSGASRCLLRPRADRQTRAGSGGGSTGSSGAPAMGSTAYRIVSSSRSGSVWLVPRCGCAHDRATALRGRSARVRPRRLRSTIGCGPAPRALRRLATARRLASEGDRGEHGFPANVNSALSPPGCAIVERSRSPGTRSLHSRGPAIDRQVTSARHRTTSIAKGA